jgi:peroxiredoxin
MSVESDRAHKGFAESLGIDFPLVSDFNRQVVGQYGIQYGQDEPFDGWHGMSRRSVFVIGQDGVIRYKWITDNPLIPPDVDQVVVCLKELRRGPASMA